MAEDGTITPEDIDEDIFEKNLLIKDSLPLDLLIRTSGVERLSDFMLWQVSKNSPNFLVKDIQLISSVSRKYGDKIHRFLLAGFFYLEVFPNVNSIPVTKPTSIIYSILRYLFTFDRLWLLILHCIHLICVSS